MHLRRFIRGCDDIGNRCRYSPTSSRDRSLAMLSKQFLASGFQDTRVTLRSQTSRTGHARDLSPDRQRVRSRFRSVMKSTDRGRSWTQISVKDPSELVDDVIVLSPSDPSVIYKFPRFLVARQHDGPRREGSSTYQFPIAFIRNSGLGSGRWAVRPPWLPDSRQHDSCKGSR
jgi:hypothetical protein